MNGNIGDRDTVLFDNLATPCTRCSTSRTISPPGGLPAQLADGHGALPARSRPTAAARAFANPSVTAHHLPVGQTGGRRVGVRSRRRAPAPGEAGQLVYYREYVTLADPATGLSATYFDNRDFTGSTLVRDRPAHRFRLRHGAAVAQPRCGPVRRALVRSGAGGPDREPTPSTPRPTTAPGSGSTASLVNDWTDHGVVENRGTIALDRRTEIRPAMEFYDNGGGALARLLWSSPGTPKAVVPADHLFQPDQRPHGRLLRRHHAERAARTPAPTRP